jgi:hypothetical protein
MYLLAFYEDIRLFILKQQLTNYMSTEDIPKPQSVISCFQE